jgi:hypothetical protein
LRSVFGRRLSRFERQTWAGIAIPVVGILLAVTIAPIARRWNDREDQIAAETERLARLRGLVANEAQLDEAVRTRGTTVETGPQRLLTGRTPAVAASVLQSTLQDFANQSRVTISRLDVAGAPETGASGLPMLPANISAIGDLYGITELLSRIQHGPLLLEITDLTVRPNSALKGELLQLSVTLRGAYLGS